MRTSRLFDALPAYLGGKRRLVPLILADLAAELPPAEWPSASFCDPMCGGGAVALAAKAQGFEVYTSDRARRGAIVAAALIANSSVRLREGDWLAALRPDDLRGTGSRPAPRTPPAPGARGASCARARAAARRSCPAPGSHHNRCSRTTLERHTGQPNCGHDWSDAYQPRRRSYVVEWRVAGMS